MLIFNCFHINVVVLCISGACSNLSSNIGVQGQCLSLMQSYLKNQADKFVLEDEQEPLSITVVFVHNYYVQIR